MKSASVSDIKKELKNLSEAQITELCLRLIKYKKDNKEYLNYLLFEAHDEQSYIQTIKGQIDEQFSQLNGTSVFFAKKTIRKVLRYTNKHIKYSGNKQTEVDLLIYFCKIFKSTNINISKYTVLNNLYQSQLNKIAKALCFLHEDVQFDFETDLEEINTYT